MPRLEFSKKASIDEMAREIDRRGDVIERLEAQIGELSRERDGWRARESETQEALQKIGEEFGVFGGEPRTDGIRRVLRDQQAQISYLTAAYVAFSRDRLAHHLAMLDGIRLQDIRSTVGPAEDANNWREYLGRADDLLAALSADMANAPPLPTTSKVME